MSKVEIQRCKAARANLPAGLIGRKATNSRPATAGGCGLEPEALNS